VEDAKTLVLDQARQEYSHDMAVMLRQMEETTREEADNKAKEIIVSSIQRYASDYVSEATVSVVTLPNDEMKGRIIGREGRNIRTIETLTGVDLIIDDTPEAVILSSFDPIRREIARIAIDKLITDGRIHPARIEEMVEKARKEVDATIKQAGDRAVFETGIMGLHPEIVKLLGKLRYRTSYGQNVLQHSIEVCWLTGMMAAELGLDVNLAKRAGLLHDLGKAADFELEGSHITLGGELARKYKESPEVINAIMSHHGDVEPDSLISVLVSAADAISAARPGARRENLETYIKRIQKLEEIANSFEGVEKSYAIQAGREIRVMVKPEDVRDDEMILKAREICKKIEEELDYPGQIKVHIIREARVTEFAK
jgi:ribonuclease Y